jgi:hypothetical protein
MTRDIRQLSSLTNLKSLRPAVSLALSLLSCSLLFSCPSAWPQDARPRISADELAREVVQNELTAQDRDKSLWKYREFSQEDGKTQILEVVETKDGDIHRVVALDGKPLTGQALRDEDRRIANLLANPGQVREKQKNAAHDADEEQKLLKLLPRAFLFQYDGTQDGLIRLHFRPNPDFNPQSHESEVFHHMEGSLLVDPHRDRLAEIQGRLTTEVKFWYGLLGHLDKGGTFVVRQRNVGGGHWETVELNVQMNGKALFFKTIAVREKEIYSDFHSLPEETTLKQAGPLLALNTPN